MARVLGIFAASSPLVALVAVPLLPVGCGGPLRVVDFASDPSDQPSVVLSNAASARWLRPQVEQVAVVADGELLSPAVTYWDHDCKYGWVQGVRVAVPPGTKQVDVVLQVTSFSRRYEIRQTLTAYKPPNAASRPAGQAWRMGPTEIRQLKASSSLDAKCNGGC